MGGSEGPTFRLDDYDYDLPDSLIAQVPSPSRGGSRLMVLDRGVAPPSHRRFDEIGCYLKPGDLLVLNDTRVVPARLQGVKESGGAVELLVLDPYKPAEQGWAEGYECLVRCSKRPKPGGAIALAGGARAVVASPVQNGRARVRFPADEPLLSLLERIGEIPLPPYIRRNGTPPGVDDRFAYQTVYASTPGAVAAPTAGLHFSESLLERLRESGVETAAVTLHVGYGTFAPIRVDDIRDHQMHAEIVEVSAEAAERIGRARAEGRRVVAVGTTVVRTLEWVALKQGALTAFSGPCTHYIYPGYRFRVVGAMLTNFHLPKSTLLLLVSALAGREAILGAYREAVRERYRFFSYGDAMLIL